MIEIGNREMPLFAREQIPGETFSEGDIVKVCVNMQEPDAHRGIRTREVLLTRVSPGFVEKLFEGSSGRLRRACTGQRCFREAGSRSKVAGGLYGRKCSTPLVLVSIPTAAEFLLFCKI